MGISGSRVVASRVTGNVEGNVTGNVSGSVVGHVLGNILGNVNGQIGQLVRSWQLVTITIGSTVGTYGAAIATVTLAKSILIPLSFTTIQASGSAGRAQLSNWDFGSNTGIRVDLQEIGLTQPPATAKALVVEYY
jgi:hypothetical protein